MWGLAHFNLCSKLKFSHFHYTLNSLRGWDSTRGFEISNTLAFLPLALLQHIYLYQHTFVFTCFNTFKSYPREATSSTRLPKSLISIELSNTGCFLFTGQRWANNSVFEYYSNTWGRILVFVFVFGWLFETEYYSYSYSGDFLKTNIIRIRIRVIFSNRILFVFVFGWFSQTE